MKKYKFVEPQESRREMVKVLTEGLGRPLTEQEINTIHWLGDCEYQTRGVLLNLFKELAQKK